MPIKSPDVMSVPLFVGTSKMFLNVAGSHLCVIMQNLNDFEDNSRFCFSKTRHVFLLTSVMYKLNRVLPIVDRFFLYLGKLKDVKKKVIQQCMDPTDRRTGKIFIKRQEQKQGEKVVSVV